MNQNARPWYFWPLIAFVVGLLIGWLVIGWGLWPVTWTNAQIRDLRPDLRLEYVGMVADSYAQTRNLEQARARLSGWSDEELAALLTEAQTVLVARNMQTAQNTQELAVALGATATTPTAATTQPAQGEQPAAPAPEAAAGGVSRLRQICTAGIFILIALGALALLWYLFRRWRSAQNGAPYADADFDDTDAVVAAEQEKARWPVREAPLDDDRQARDAYAPPPVRPYMPVDASPAPADLPPAPASVPLTPVGPAPVDTPRPEAPPLKPVVTTPPPSGEKLTLIAEKTAVYQMGEPDYDEAFDITDPTDGFMGQFGLQLIEPFGRERDQAVALQVWLWDSSDPDTQAKVLMSEGAYRDTALRSQHAGELEAVSARPGQDFTLTSHDLLLKGRVEKASYAEAEPPRGVFADLHVKFMVYRRG